MGGLYTLHSLYVTYSGSHSTLLIVFIQPTRNHTVHYIQFICNLPGLTHISYIITNKSPPLLRDLHKWWGSLVGHRVTRTFQGPGQTCNLSQASEACLCKYFGFGLKKSFYLKHTLFLLRICLSLCTRL